MKTIRIGLVGCGVVGGGLLELIRRHGPDFRANGLDLRVQHIAVRDPARARDFALPVAPVSDAMAVANAPDIDVLVEIMGGDTLAVQAGCAALRRGIPLVTANKAALARRLPEYIEAAAGTPIGFEAACAAHIPIIQVLESSLAVEQISGLKGVINGSTNYILTFMERAGCEYDAALADAAAKGFTEADPSLDVLGIDSAEKLSLLALKAFGTWVPPGQVQTQGITGITQADIGLALAMDHRIKLVASARRVEGGLSLRVHPALIHRGELLADVDSEFNAIILEGPSFHQLTFLGKGAGSLPTASAVLNDIVRIARGGRGALPGIARANAPRVVHTNGSAQCWFVRVAVRAGTAPGVLDALRASGVTVLNHAEIEVTGCRYLGLITDVVPESGIMGALPGPGAPGVIGEPVLIRLDKDTYRDIVDREQRAYFGASLERQPRPGV